MDIMRARALSDPNVVYLVAKRVAAAKPFGNLRKVPDFPRDGALAAVVRRSKSSISGQSEFACMNRLADGEPATPVTTGWSVSCGKLSQRLRRYRDPMVKSRKLL